MSNATPQPLPMSKRLRDSFVSRKTKRLSPRFFFDKKGKARLAVQKAEGNYEGSIFMAWTPFKVAVGHLEDDPFWFERCTAWLSEYADDCWFLWMGVFEVGGQQTAIGFRSQRDAALFKLFCA